MESPELRTIVSTHYFNSSIKQVWDMLKDINKTNAIANYIFPASPVKFIKGNHTYELGSEFSFIFKNSLTFYFTCTEIMESESYNKITWRVFKTEPETILYDISYNLHIKSENECVLIMFMKCEYNDNIDLGDQVVTLQERHLIYEELDHAVSAQNNSKIQIESIIVKSPVLKIFNFITNLKKFQKNIPIICDKVECQDEIKEKSQFYFKWYKRVQLEVELFVKKLYANDESSIFIYESMNKNPAIPSQEVIWKVYKINESNSLVVFKHRFEEDIKKKLLENIAKNKRKILQNIKSYFEEKEIITSGINNISMKL